MHISEALKEYNIPFNEKTEVLNLNNKNISDISNFDFLNLKVLFLEDNNISNVENIDFKNIEDLDLSSNDISIINQNFNI